MNSVNSLVMHWQNMPVFIVRLSRTPVRPLCSSPTEQHAQSKKVDIKNLASGNHFFWARLVLDDESILVKQEQ